jgi:hypothetical protein
MVFPYDLESQRCYAWGEQIWSNSNSALEQTKKFLSYR